MATKTTAKKAELGTSTAKATKVKEAPAKDCSCCTGRRSCKERNCSQRAQ